VLTTGWRCSRRRLDVDGGAASVFTVAFGFTLVRLLASPTIPSSGAPAATRHTSSSCSASTSPTLPFLSPLGGAHTGMGKTPMRVGWRREGSVPGDVDARSRRCEGMGAPALQDWLLARPRRRGRPSVAATASGASPAGAQESFPPQIPPWGGPRVRASARRACQLGGPAVPSSRARGCGAVRRRKVGSGGKVGVGEER
jgi:hypothetical protein